MHWIGQIFLKRESIRALLLLYIFSKSYVEHNFYGQDDENVFNLFLQFSQTHARHAWSVYRKAIHVAQLRKP